jgi:hypothetical protein
MTAFSCAGQKILSAGEMVRALTTSLTALLAIALSGVPAAAATVALLYTVPAHITFPALPALLSLLQLVPAAWGISRVFGTPGEQ